ncbi:jg25194 [Pararge aegeria aegeria]|uniref:Jg25194 protein n=1 Tax=Pararge aegeria aegeria TaxID=348720 RepID=A0A8S4RY50_9NEOP|nr:jg25194 [Pararge aegeria aegeria]
MQPKMKRACLEDGYSLLVRRYPDYRYRGRRKMGGHSRLLGCGSERKKQNASYVLMVFQQRNGADSFEQHFEVPTTCALCPSTYHTGNQALQTGLQQFCLAAQIILGSSATLHEALGDLGGLLSFWSELGWLE